MPWHDKRLRCLRYVGSKLRIVPRIATHLHNSGRDCLVDVFGGSGAIIMNAGFTKRVYNDYSGELVNFFKVMANPEQRLAVTRALKRLPMARLIYNEMQAVRHNPDAADPVSKAIALFYVSSFAFGGKISTGGFAASTAEREQVKELRRYRGILRDFAKVGQFWQNTVIEHQDFAECINAYGRRENVVLYCDPPYYGTEGYYKGAFNKTDHERLAEALRASTCPAVVSYYPNAALADLYPEADGWHQIVIETTKNSMGRSTTKKHGRELLICRGTQCIEDLPLFALSNQ